MLDFSEALPQAFVVGCLFEEVLGVFFDFICSLRVDEGSNVVVISLNEELMRVDERLELILVPMMEIPLRLCLEQSLV